MSHRILTIALLSLLTLAATAIASMMIYDRVQQHSARQLLAQLRNLEGRCAADQVLFKRLPPGQHDYCADLATFVAQTGIPSDLLQD